jgi:hypothetical protein
MTKSEQFKYLLDNMSKISHENQNLKKDYNKSQRLCISLNDHGIIIPIFNSHESIRQYFTGEKGLCEICENECKLDSNNIKNGFKQFCSSPCHMAWRSKRQSSNNTIHRIKDRKKWSENLSLKLKSAIQEGRFTPNVTNSWCNSRRKVILEDRTVNVRSSWEEKFLLMNPTFLYEKTRIPYIDMHGIARIYIVDFTDLQGNIYEIKPTSKIGENSEKINAAKEYAKIHKVEFFLITENELNENKTY